MGARAPVADWSLSDGKGAAGEEDGAACWPHPFPPGGAVAVVELVVAAVVLAAPGRIPALPMLSSSRSCAASMAARAATCAQDSLVMAAMPPDPARPSMSADGSAGAAVGWDGSLALHPAGTEAALVNKLPDVEYWYDESVAGGSVCMML